MAFEFRLPDIGEGVVEGEIVRWLVSPGDAVREDQPIVEVMTDKATVEISSPRAGKVLAAAGGPGDIVKVHSVILTLDTGAGEAVPEPAPVAAAVAGTAVPPVRPAAAARPAAPSAGAPTRPSGKVLATPATRHLARELGVDIGRATGTGDGGRVTQDDVRALQAGGGGTGALPAPPGRPAAPPAPPAARPLAPEPATEERIPIRGLRKRIYEAMVASKTTIPHFSYVDECDMSALVDLRSRWKPAAERRGVKLTYLPFFLKALVAAFRDFPELNAWCDDAAQELVVKKVFHIGVSTDTPSGLFVAVVRDCDRKSILEIARDLHDVVERVRQGKAGREDLTGSTFTVTSVGNFGGMFATPIINKPEVAILGLNRIHDRPVVRDGQIVVRPMMYLSPSFDHRVIDGAVGARFTNRLKALLESPDELFMEMR